MRYAGVAMALVLLMAPAGAGLAAVFDTTSTPAELRRAYRDARRGDDKVKILVVPGHDDQFSGAAFGGLREADLTLALAQEIAERLGEDKRLEVRLSRTEEGYDPDLIEYFTDRRGQVEDFMARHKDRMERYLESGEVGSQSGIEHGIAPSEMALRLYAINKWANDEDYDLVVHVHFNDTPRYDLSRPGWPSGFSLYVPERQFGNARGSMGVAQALQKRLEDTLRRSTLPQELGSPVEDQHLIAIGANNTLQAASILVEYSYIYEPSVQSPMLRQGALESMAEQTRLGLSDFFSGR